jgi:light-regulated signal transduction histidine kinase (bacteriophytochrome)
MVESVPDPSGRAVASVTPEAALARAERELAIRTEQLRCANEMLAHFAYVASHDLREPLRTIASFLVLLTRRYQGQLGEDADELIGFAVGGTRRMRALLDGLLAYSEVATRGQSFATVDLTATLAQAIECLRPHIEDAHATVTGESLPLVHGDGAQIEYVLRHLIANAIKFRRAAAPLVHVAAERDGAFWHVSVRDNGIGIAPGQADRVFRMFHPLEPGRYPGTGASLAICRQIVFRHGGRMWAEPSAGGGTTFRFTLPAVADGALAHDPARTYTAAD